MNATLGTLPHFHTGKVRQTYLIPEHPELLLMVASDRLSTHNVKHKSPVPGKGEILTAQMVFMMREVLTDVPTHLIASGEAIWKYLPAGLRKEAHGLELRAVVIRKRKPHKREFVWRGYLTGSLYKALQEEGRDPYGLGMRADLPLMYEFPHPMFTPTMKSEADEPVSAEETHRLFPFATELTHLAFVLQSDFLKSRGLVLIDQKSEADEEMLLDETGTGDCSRIAYAGDVREGVNPPFFDKEVFRQVAERMWAGGKKVPLVFPDVIIEGGLRSYNSAFETIVEMPLSRFQKEGLSYDKGL